MVITWYISYIPGNDLVLCGISTTLALWTVEILTVYTIMLVTRCFP